MRCWHCGREIPADAAYCPFCGAHQLHPAQTPAARRRPRTFAANPNEHVLHPSVISTLTPHLGPARMFQARWLLAALAIVVFLIGLGRLVPLAIVLSALLLPVLYLAYFYEAQIYEDEPLPVLAATFLAGAVLGVLLSFANYRLLLSLQRLALGAHPTAGYILLTGVVFPIVAQALMLVGPLILYRVRPRFDEMLDGFAFGAAAGLGFAATQSLTYSWQLLISRFQQRGPAVSWALPTIRIALLVPLLDAASTGLICAALWLRRDHRAHPAAASGEIRALGPLASLPVAVVVALLGQILPSLLSDLIGGLVVTLVWYALAVVALLLAVRVVLHAGLIEKARPLGHGGELTCPQCGHRIGDVAFCPYCGLALRATTKRERRAARQPREEAGDA
jgi:RsiW-degrading membrane proteinase PrsW (M82 family)/DNA-directed RNA polymerase subunit RPC12/RpoP